MSECYFFFPYFCSSDQFLLSFNFLIYKYFSLFTLSKLISSESQGQEEAACTRPAYTTASVLFTATNAVKFASTVTRVILSTIT